MRHIPNITVMVPADEAELRDMMAAALSMDGPVALRYPRGVGVGVGFEGEPNPVPTSEGVMIREVDKPDVMIVAVGSRVHPSREAAEELAEEGLSVGVFNARFVKPLPAKQLLELADTCPNWVLAEENARQGGFGSAVLELLAEHDKDVHVRLLGLPDAFVEHGKQRDLRAKIGLDKAGIKDLVRKLKS
jgi:1-deoxy-D-xylulose-5-phosphate synthase